MMEKIKQLYFWIFREKKEKHKKSRGLRWKIAAWRSIEGIYWMSVLTLVQYKISHLYISLDLQKDTSLKVAVTGAVSKVAIIMTKSIPLLFSILLIPFSSFTLFYLPFSCCGAISRLVELQIKKIKF